MAYKRRYGRSRKYRRRRSKPAWYNKKYSAKDLASYALSQTGNIMRMLNTEKKFIDTADNGYDCYSGASLIHLTNIVRGDDYNNRSGRQVKLTDLNARLNFSCSTLGSDIIRICIVQLRQTAVPAVTDIFTAGAVQAFRNLNNVRDIKMLYDKTFSIDQDDKNNLLDRS